MAVQLADLLIQAGELEPEARAVKKEGLLELGKRCTSANGRHYYIASAKELTE